MVTATATDVRNKILVGDVLENLRKLPSAFVHCIVTSPPYWGLRDYGAASWEGGDAGCGHRSTLKKQTQGKTSAREGRANVEAQRGASLRATCARCGATRIDRQLGLESTPAEYVQRMVEIFREIRRVLRHDGVLWVNMGDSYAGSGKGRVYDGSHHKDPSAKQATNRGSIVGVVPNLRGGARRPDKQCTNRGTLKAVKFKDVVGVQPRNYALHGLKPKDLCLIPARLAIALQDDGWWVRQDNIWFKTNPMPESCRDRTTRTHEYIFQLTPSEHCWYDADAVAEPVTDETIYDSPANDGRVERGFPDPHASNGNGKLGTGIVRNKRSVWRFATEQNPLERCSACGRIFSRQTRRLIKIDPETDARICPCGARDAWVAHFASFPQELVQPCMLASTSAHGACGTCGAQWDRKTKRETVAKGYRSDGADRQAMCTDPLVRATRSPDLEGATRTVTTGWEPSCECHGTIETVEVPDPSEPDGMGTEKVYRPAIPLKEHPIARPIVMDPFMGSGTTALVALKGGRDFVGIELNADYVAIAQERIRPELEQGRLM